MFYEDEFDYTPKFENEFDVDLRVVCTKVVEIEADTEEEAIEKLEEMIGRGEIDLDFNFSGRIPSNVDLIDVTVR